MLLTNKGKEPKGMVVVLNDTWIAITKSEEIAQENTIIVHMCNL